MAKLRIPFSGLSIDIGVKRTAANPRKTVGVGGTAVYGGYIQTKEKNSDLVGQKRYTTYSNILANTSIAAAGTRFFLNLVAKAKWTFEPADDSPDALEKAEMMDEIVNDMTTSWRRVVRRAAMYRFYGFSLQEWTAKLRDDGVIGYLDIEPRPQNTIIKWDVDETGTVHGVVQQSPQDYREIYLPRKKLVYLVDDSLDDSPEGLGLFRHIVETAHQLKRFEQLEGFGFETDLRGIPVGRAPFAALEELVQDGTITTAQRLAIEAPIRDFVQNHTKTPELGLLLDSMVYESSDEAERPSNVRQFDMELLQGGTTSQEQVAKAIERKNREIARVLGVEHLMLGEGARGSAALSVDKSKNFALMVDGTLDEIVEQFETDVIDPIWELNGWDESTKPTPKVEAIQHRQITEITTALTDMATAGAVLDPEDPAINEVRGLLGLSEAIPVATAMDTAIPGGLPGDDGATPAEGASAGTTEETVETMTDEEDDDA